MNAEEERRQRERALWWNNTVAFGIGIFLMGGVFAYFIGGDEKTFYVFIWPVLIIFGVFWLPLIWNWFLRTILRIKV